MVKHVTKLIIMFYRTDQIGILRKSRMLLPQEVEVSSDGPAWKDKREKEELISFKIS